MKRRSFIQNTILLSFGFPHIVKWLHSDEKRIENYNSEYRFTPNATGVYLVNGMAHLAPGEQLRLIENGGKTLSITKVLEDSPKSMDIYLNHILQVKDKNNYYEVLIQTVDAFGVIRKRTGGDFFIALIN